MSEAKPMERGASELIAELFLLVRPAPDVAGQWVAHCLDFDVVSQGNSPIHALHMMMEATTIVVADDLARGADPFARKAPDSDFDEFMAIRKAAQRIASFDEVPPNAIIACNVRVHLTMQKTVIEHETSQLPAWVIAGAKQNSDSLRR